MYSKMMNENAEKIFNYIIVVTSILFNKLLEKNTYKCNYFFIIFDWNPLYVPNRISSYPAY